MEHEFISIRHGDITPLYMIELAVLNSEPINFYIYGFQARYVPERTCKFVPFVEEDGSVIVENCSECDFPVPARCWFQYCPDCGARVVE